MVSGLAKQLGLFRRKKSCNGVPSFGRLAAPRFRRHDITNWLGILATRLFANSSAVLLSPQNLYHRDFINRLLGRSGYPIHKFRRSKASLEPRRGTAQRASAICVRCSADFLTQVGS
jgi:coproporphyrinogen III oxidase-like Fe-S oxidoreductase